MTLACYGALEIVGVIIIIFNFIRRKRQHKQRTTAAVTAADKQTYKQL